MMDATENQGAAVPAKKAEEQPQQGGSYIRHDDGTLERTGGTEPAKNTAATLPPALQGGAKE